MNKLVVVIMGQNVEKFIGMSLESVKDADTIIYCDGGSTDNTLKIVNKFLMLDKQKEKKNGTDTIITNQYNQEDKLMNGRQRNFYLQYLKENYPDDWCLVLDADEVVEDLNKIKEFIQKATDGLYSVKMRHLIQDLSHEDNTANTHWVLNRLFKISEAESYPEVEHPVLHGLVMGQTDCTTIWHLGHINEMFNVKKKYDNHLKKSNMHTPDYLKQWYYHHLFGTYPKKKFDPVELPSIILNYFGVNKDEIYFSNRGLELKHFIDAIHWKEFFKCESVVEAGCGRGPRVFAMKNIGLDVSGFELSEYAVNNRLGSEIFLGDILTINIAETFDLVIAYDLLEHIKYKDLDKAIDNLVKLTNHNILISVPVIGDPNLDNDPTHIIKETKDWWIKQFTNKGLKHIETPEYFLYREQIMIFTKI